ncbi:MAG: hypothetical protein LQ345_005543 [Seirophora villosa]|nr:MAG: hypothetical protein LQ345_005543 [Seirophora villosa]
MPFVPGSGGYNGSSMTSPLAAAPTGTVAPPKPTATFISSAEKVETYGGQGTVFAVVVGVHAVRKAGVMDFVVRLDCAVSKKPVLIALCNALTGLRRDEQ